MSTFAPASTTPTRQLAHQNLGALNKYDFFLAAGLGMVGFLAYLTTLAPGLLPGDSGEFQVLGYFYSTAHTTGYAIYLLLAKVFSLLPVEDIAYRINLFSAVMAGVTLGLLFLAGRLVSGSRMGAALASASLALSATFWSQAIIAEVYTTASAFFTAIVLLLLLAAQATSAAARGRRLFLAGLLGGLGMGVHGSIVLLAPAAAFWLLAHASLRRAWLPASGGAAIGLALMTGAFFVMDNNRAAYNSFNAIYIPAASAWNSEPQSLDNPAARFQFMITARQWRMAMFRDPGAVMVVNAQKYGDTLQADFAWIFPALALLGTLSLWRRDWRLAAFLLVALLSHHVYTFNYEIGDLYVFFISAYVLMVLLAAAGIAQLSAWAAGWGQLNSRLVQIGVGLVCLVLLLAPTAAERLAALRAGEAHFSFYWHKPENELASWRSALRSTVRDLEPNAILMADWYDLYPYYYVAYIEMDRSDLRFIEARPAADPPGLSASAVQFIQLTCQTRPVYFGMAMEELPYAGIETIKKRVGSVTLFKVIQPLP